MGKAPPPTHLFSVGPLNRDFMAKILEQKIKVALNERN